MVNGIQLSSGLLRIVGSPPSAGTVTGKTIAIRLGADADSLDSVALIATDPQWLAALEDAVKLARKRLEARR